MVPHMASQVAVCFIPSPPSAGMILSCKLMRSEARDWVHKNTHFTTEYAQDGFRALGRLSFDYSLSLMQSIDLDTRSLYHPPGVSAWAWKLNLLVREMPALRFVRISSAFRDDDTDRFNLPASGLDLLDMCEALWSLLLRFGALTTLRHPKLKLLVWAKPTMNMAFAGNHNALIHYTLKIMANDCLIKPNATDIVLNSTAIRQRTFPELAEVEPEYFRAPKKSKTSECGHDVRYSMITATRFSAVARSRIDDIVHLTSAERKVRGLHKDYGFDHLILQARTGLLESKYAPTYAAIHGNDARPTSAETIKHADAELGPLREENNTTLANATTPASIPAENLIESTTEMKTEAQPNMTEVRGLQRPDAESQGQIPPFKRGDLVQYLLDHDGNLDDMDNYFSAGALPQHLRPVKPAKPRRDRKNNRKTKKNKQQDLREYMVEHNGDLSNLDRDIPLSKKRWRKK